MKVALLCVLVAGTLAKDYVHEPVQYQNQPKEDGTYSFGYDTGLFGAHSLHYQYRDENGVVHGRYAYTDPSGNLRSVEYTAGPDGYRVKGDVGPDGSPKSEVPARTPPSEDVILAAADTRFESSRHFHPNREHKGTPYRSTNLPHLHIENKGIPTVILPKNPVFIDTRLEDQIHSQDILRKPRPVPYQQPIPVIHPNADIKGRPILVHQDVQPYIHQDIKPIINPKGRIPHVDIHPNSDIKGMPLHVNPKVRMPYVDVHPNAEIKGSPVVMSPKVRYADIHPNADIKGGGPIVVSPKGRPHIDVHPNAELKGTPIVISPKTRPHVDMHPNAELKGTPIAISPKARPHVDIHPNAELKGTPIVISPKTIPHVDIHPNANIKGKAPIVITPKSVPHVDAPIPTKFKGTPFVSPPKTIIAPPKGRPHYDYHPNADVKGGTPIVIPPKGRPHIDIHPNADIKGGTPIVIPPKGRPHIDIHPNTDIKGGTPIVIPPKGRPHVHINEEVKGSPIPPMKRPHIDVHPSRDMKGIPIPPSIIVKSSKHLNDHHEITINQKNVHVPPQPAVIHSTKGITPHIDVHKVVPEMTYIPKVPVIQKKHHHDRSEMVVQEEVIHPGGLKGSRFVSPPPPLMKTIDHHHHDEIIAPHIHKTDSIRQGRMLDQQIHVPSIGEQQVHSDVNIHRDVQVIQEPGRVMPSRNGSHVHVHVDSKTNKTVVHIHRDPPTRGPHIHVHRDPVTHELFYHTHADPDPLRPHFHNQSSYPEHANHSLEGHVHQHRDPKDNHTYLHLHGDQAGHMHVHPDDGTRQRSVEHVGNLVVTTVRDGTGRMVSRHIHPVGEHAHRSGHYRADDSHTAEYGAEFQQEVQRMDDQERLERALHRTAHSDYRHHQGRYVYGVSQHDGRLAARRVSQDDDHPVDHLVA